MSDDLALDQALASSIRASKGSDHPVHTFLKTDQRVIARVTDGIYRQPASAIRELISNSYDADATRVAIATDAPRFDRISVEDDGHGMSPEALAHLLLHIGGSAKRNSIGGTLGVTSEDDPLRSPNGRRLIGKIGIGLFSVSQLTHSFQIITKEKKDPFRTVATVALRQYGEDDAKSQKVANKFESGQVHIWREKAADLDSHGTTVVLTGIRPQARDTLRSRDIWSTIERNEALSEGAEKQAIEPPRFHIGRVDKSGELLTKASGRLNSLPWGASDTPAEAFNKLVEAVWDEVNEGDPNPRLERVFDYYLRMVWQLSLAVPLPYVQGHLFDKALNGKADVFLLSNLVKGAAEHVSLAPSLPLRNQLTLTDPAEAMGKFDVYLDDLKLFRPIKFEDLPNATHSLKQPLVFIGKCRETFPKIALELSGGPLAFEAYLLWTPKVAPTEHQGSLIRIHGSSGTLFDSTFMRYQVSEQTRLRQITCEIFVSEGLDSALNIDRESFNNAHPHTVYITKWLHGALRQLANAHKRLAGEVREQARDESTEVSVSNIRSIARNVWQQETEDVASTPPRIEILASPEKGAEKGAYVFARTAVVSSKPQRNTTGLKAKAEILEEKLKAIAQVLAAFGLLDALTKRKREQLLRAIFNVLDAPED